MSYEIKVDEELLSNLVVKVQDIPNRHIDQMLKRLELLETTIASWKGESRQAYDELHIEMKQTLDETKLLMTAILQALDKTKSEFKEMDQKISTTFDQSGMEK